MRDYFIKRLLLILPTLFGITIACFVVMQMVPGGPVEQAIQRIKSSTQSGTTMVLTNQYWFAIFGGWESYSVLILVLHMFMKNPSFKSSPVDFRFL
jgi:ABC-type dipeptide/oligopeptide/nickel transport system permease component